MAPMGTVQLVQEHGSHQVVEVLTGLLQAAKNHEINGIVFGLALRGRRVMCESAGTLYRDPLKGAAVCALLTRQMLDLVEKTSDETLF